MLLQTIHFFIACYHLFKKTDRFCCALAANRKIEIQFGIFLRSYLYENRKASNAHNAPYFYHLQNYVQQTQYQI